MSSDAISILREIADALEAERPEIQEMQRRVSVVLVWCRKNIESKSIVAPFCIQVRDLLEGAVAQGLEQGSYMPEVEGSIPSSPTTCGWCDHPDYDCHEHN